MQEVSRCVDFRSFAELIQTVGFPIVVAMFVLIRMDRSLGRLTSAVRGLSAQMSRSTWKMEREPGNDV